MLRLDLKRSAVRRCLAAGTDNRCRRCHPRKLEKNIDKSFKWEKGQFLKHLLEICLRFSIPKEKCLQCFFYHKNHLSLVGDLFRVHFHLNFCSEMWIFQINLLYLTEMICFVPNLIQTYRTTPISQFLFYFIYILLPWIYFQILKFKNFLNRLKCKVFIANLENIFI